MTQFGMYSDTTPRNDASPARGQWNLDNAYRYISEAYGGYHFNTCTVSTWMPESSCPTLVCSATTSSITGHISRRMSLRTRRGSSTVCACRWFPTEKLKIEPWFINGWQSYGRFNNRPGLGGQILWRPKGRLSILGNQYGYGEDALGIPERTRYHTDDSVRVQVLRQPHVIRQQGGLLTYGRCGLRKRRRRELLRRSRRRPKQSFLGLHGLQPLLVRPRSLRPDDRRRRDQQSGPLPGVAASDQRSNRDFGHAVLHRESRRSVQGVGCVRRRSDYMPSQYITWRLEYNHRAANVPVLHRAWRRNASRRKYRSAGIVRSGVDAGSSQ